MTYCDRFGAHAPRDSCKIQLFKLQHREHFVQDRIDQILGLLIGVLAAHDVNLDISFRIDRDTSPHSKRILGAAFLRTAREERLETFATFLNNLTSCI